MSPVVASLRFSLSRLLFLLLVGSLWFAPALLLAPATAARAQDTYTVNVLTDDYSGTTTNLNGTAGNCPANGTGTICSLRDAITAANTDAGSTILFTGLSGDLPLGYALPPIAVNMTIDGTGATIAIDGQNATSAIAVNAGTVIIQNLTIANGNAATTGAVGGAIYNQANLTVNNVVFQNDTTEGGGTGGALYNVGTLAVNTSTFNNDSAGNGGAIFNDVAGTLTVSDCTFTGNTANSYGGAVYQNNGNLLTIASSTFVGNTATGGFGGGVYSAAAGASLTVQDSTFSGNTASADGSGVAYKGTTLTLDNNIFVESAECFAEGGSTCPANGQYGNLVGSSSTTTAASLGLLPLGNYGGPTETMLPLPTSAAVCAGDATLVPGGIAAYTDQRGFVSNATCADAGADQSNYITVTSGADDAIPGTAGNCPGAACLLRDAIAAANAVRGGDIDFANGLNTITIGIPTTATEGPSIFYDTNIIGPGANSLTVTGQSNYVILGAKGGNVYLSGMTFANGYNNAGAGEDGTGGAIYNQTNLTLNGMSFTGNNATNSGGAIHSQTGTVTVLDSTFANNTSPAGSAIFNNDSADPLTIEYSTFTGNTANGAGAVHSLNGASLSVFNTTLSGNTPYGINFDAGSLTVENDIFADAGECTSSYCPTSGGGNVYPASTPALAALGNYGGTTPTMIPLPGSSAICAGILGDIPAGVTTDQRGFANTNTDYGVANCVDAGSVQTDYTAIGFNDTSYAGSVNVAGTTPPVIVSLTENGQNIGGVPVTLDFSGTGTATGTTATTVDGTGATFSSLTVNAQGSDELSVSMNVVGGDTLAAGPETLTIGAAGTVTTTTTVATPAPDSFVVSATNTPVTLSATVKHAGTAVTEGYVTFTVNSGSPTGTLVGAAVGPIALNGTGSTGNVTYTIPANEPVGTYYVTASYADPGGPGNYKSSTNSSQTITIDAALSATVQHATETLTENYATSFTPVTGSGGTTPYTYSITVGTLPAGLSINSGSGLISGTPTATLAATQFTVKVTDHNGATATGQFTLTVNTAVTATVQHATEVLTEGVAASFTPVTGSGGTGTLAYSITVGTLPAGLSINSGNGLISGTPTATLAATQFTVTVTDANGATTSGQFTLTVNGTLTATVQHATETLTEGLAASFTPVTASGGTTPYTYSITVGTLPAGLSINSGSGLISGTPTANLAATQFTVKVTDANGATATGQFTLTVNGTLSATVQHATETLTEGFAASFTPVTGSGGTTPYTYSITVGTLPAGLSINSGSGLISGTPTATLAATQFTVTVTDTNGATATGQFTLTVNTAVTATVQHATEVLTEGVAASFTPVTGSGGTGTLAYSITVGTLPAGLSINSGNGLISGTPTATLAATPFTVTVTDANGATASGQFTLTVNGTLTATVQHATETLTENYAASFTPVTASGGTTPYTYSISVGTLPAGLSINTTNGLISGTPTATLAATQFTVKVTDANGATATGQFTLTVNGTLSATVQHATETLTENFAASFTPVTGSGGTTPYTYSITVGTLPAGLSINSGSGLISGTPTATLAATPFTVTVTDANGATATGQFTLAVNGPLTATVQHATETLNEGVAASFTPVTGSGGTTPLAYSITVGTLPAGLSINSTNGLISGTPTATLAATQFTVTVTDANGATATGQFTLTVNGTLTATVQHATETLTEGLAASFTPVTASGGTTPYTYSITVGTLPAGLSINSSNGLISGTPTATLAATQFTVTVTDANGATASGQFTLTVNGTLTATVQHATETLTENYAASFTPVTASGGTTPYTYSISVGTLPAGLSINTTNGLISGTPTATLAATQLTVKVTDANGATATGQFTLTVNGTLSATVQHATETLTEGFAASFTPVTGSGGTTPYTYSITVGTLPAGLSINSSSGLISGTPTATLAATSFTVTVTDANGATATGQFTLTVNGTLTATTAIPTTTLVTGQVAAAFTPVTGSGGTAPLSYSVSPALPAGLTMSTTTGQITGTPTVTTNATTYTVTVTDATSATATATFSLTVNSATTSITWANPAPITYPTTLSGVLNATVTNNGSTVPGTFTYTAQPTGGSATTVTAATVLDAGSYTLTASFAPSSNAYATPPAKSVPLTVNQAQPTLSWTPATTIAYGSNLSALLNATASFGGNSVAGGFAYTATPAGGSAVTVTSSTVLANGTYTLTVTFTPTNTTDYKTATASSPLTVTSQTLTVTANNATKVYGAPNPTFTGTITGQQNGDTFTESFTTSATISSNVGTYPIVPSASGANLSDYTVVVDDGTLTIGRAASTTTLAVNNSTVGVGASLTLTATVASTTTGTPTGTVGFYDGSTLLDTATLSAGVATYSTTSLSSGSHTITAVYSGDTNFTGSSTTSATTVTVSALDFTMTATPSTQLGNPGTTFTYQLAVAPAYSGTPYPGTLTFSATGVPTGATLTFTPSSVGANAGPQTVSMAIATAATGSAAVEPFEIGRKMAPLALAFLLLPFAGTRRIRRHGRQLSRMICLLLLALGGIMATTALSGCGSNNNFNGQKTPQGTLYTITVTGTSGAVTHTSTVTLTLQ